MVLYNARLISRNVLTLAAFTFVLVTQSAAQNLPGLVAKPYPDSVPEHMKNGKHVICGDSKGAYCFLTRDPIDKVSAFYAQQGAKLESISAKERANVGGWRSNFEQSVRASLENKPSALMAAPLEFYKTKGADDEPSYFNAVIVMAGAKKTPVSANDKGKQTIIDDRVLGLLALTPISKIMVPLYGNIYMEPDKLVSHYNRHLDMLSGYFRVVDGNSAEKMKYMELHPDWVQPAGSDANAQMAQMKNELAESQMENELSDILDRKPDKKREYRALLRGNRSGEARTRIQPELDKVLMSDPELAAWKTRWDALVQRTRTGSAKEAAPGNRTLRDNDVEAYLQALEKEVYYTRILIHASEGRRVTRDAATIRREWVQY
jgi:hypothetical protein